ncbi:hypothetical protein NPIL_122731, partial [Nephila pilipes]
VIDVGSNIALGDAMR